MPPSVPAESIKWIPSTWNWVLYFDFFPSSICAVRSNNKVRASNRSVYSLGADLFSYLMLLKGVWITNKPQISIINAVCWLKAPSGLFGTGSIWWLWHNFSNNEVMCLLNSLLKKTLFMDYIESHIMPLIFP